MKIMLGEQVLKVEEKSQKNGLIWNVLNVCILRPSEICTATILLSRVTTMKSYTYWLLFSGQAKTFSLILTSDWQLLKLRG